MKTLARREVLADQHLSRQGFETYLPLILSGPARYTVGLARKQAFFPGYLFIKLNPDQHRWRSVNGTIGVTQILQSGGRPAPVPTGLVEHLQERTSAGVLGFEDDIRPGTRVRVVGGPFDRFTGVFQGLDGPGRVRLLLDCLGRSTSVSIERASVMVA